MIKNLLIITSFTLCSALGAAMRLELTNLAKAIWGKSFYGTLIVNLIGAACIGVFYVVFNQVWEEIDHNWYYVIIAGLLGSLTTFSGFVLEIVTMLIQKQWSLAMIYAAASVFLCVLATLLTVKLTYWITSL